MIEFFPAREINGPFNWKMHVLYFIFFNAIITEEVEGLDIYKDKIVQPFKRNCSSNEFGSIFWRT